jgi:hypothetical protein
MGFPIQYSLSDLRKARALVLLLSEDLLNRVAYIRFAIGSGEDWYVKGVYISSS